MELTESKKRLERSLESLEKLLETRVSSISASEYHQLNEENVALAEENRLLKDSLVEHSKELQELKDKNRVALESVQTMIRNIEDQMEK